MHAGKNLPVVTDHALLFDALFEISEKGLGMAAVVDKNGKLVGIFTDGDLRRVLEKGLDLQKTPIAQVMTKNPQTIDPHALAVEAAEIMEKRKINGLLVVDKGVLLGALNMHDLCAPRSSRAPCAGLIPGLCHHQNGWLQGYRPPESAQTAGFVRESVQHRNACRPYKGRGAGFCRPVARF